MLLSHLSSPGRRLLVALCCAAVLNSLASLASAQQAPQPPAIPAAQPAAGSIHGIVEGKDGEVYEGVRVTLAIGATRQSEDTNSAGEFSFAGVAPGSFTLTFTSQGFETVTYSGDLHSGEDFNVPGTVLALKESVSVIHVSAEQQVEIAEEQIHLEERQRVFGVLPNYYVIYSPNPMPLTAKQKFELAWRSNIDPFNWLTNAGFAGIQQATNSFKGYGPGWPGYGKRFGADTADSFFSTMIGSAALPALFHQDPRYFYKGTGTIKARFGYAVANAVICKGDNMHWQFNYSGILGGLAAGGISNLYYPEGERSDLVVTFEGAGIGLAGTAVQNLFQEFLIRKLTPHANRQNTP